MNHAIGAIANLDGVYVNGKHFPFSKDVTDPSNFAQRLGYFKRVISAVINVHSKPAAFKEYQEGINRNLQLSTRRAAPHAPVAGEPLSYWEIKKNTEFGNNLSSLAKKYVNDSVVPKTEVKKINTKAKKK